MPIAEVNGIEIYYEVHGKGSPLILICGFTNNSETWESELVDSLSKHHTLILFDNRDTGRSTKPSLEYSIKTMADDLEGLLKVINVQKAHIFGHSMGGMIAQEFALNFPEKVNRLVLGCTSCGGNKFVASKEVMDFMQNLSEGIFPKMSRDEYVEYLFRFAYSPTFLKKNKESLVKRLVKTKYPSTPNTFIRHTQAVLKFDTFNRLDGIKQPTLLLHGEEDDWVIPYNSKILHRRIPDSKLIMIKDAGHVFIVEARKQVVKIMLDFLSE
jgi:pimeloyl-ACP methyl ester carboxylesterase